MDGVSTFTLDGFSLLLHDLIYIGPFQTIFRTINQPGMAIIRPTFRSHISSLTFAVKFIIAPARETARPAQAQPVGLLHLDELEQGKHQERLPRPQHRRVRKEGWRA